MQTVTTTPKITTRSYVRSHNKAPQGFGSWAFQASSTEVAFDKDLAEPTVFFTGFYKDACLHARVHFSGLGYRWVAVLG